MFKKLIATLKTYNSLKSFYEKQYTIKLKALEKLTAIKIDDNCLNIKSKIQILQELVGRIEEVDVENVVPFRTLCFDEDIEYYESKRAGSEEKDISDVNERSFLELSKISNRAFCELSLKDKLKD